LFFTVLRRAEERQAVVLVRAKLGAEADLELLKRRAVGRYLSDEKSRSSAAATALALAASSAMAASGADTQAVPKSANADRRTIIANLDIFRVS
jgi:hypothetical protein